MTLPNFLIIGAMKSGTSSLHQYLKEHPQVFMTTRKELNFFTSEQLPWQAGLSNLSKPPAETHPILQLYAKFFSEAPAEISAIGEATTTYLHHPPVVERIRQYLPDTKLICILRNPIDRAYSHFHHQLRRGEASHFTFRDILHSNIMQCPEGYIRLGYYHQYLQPYFEKFPANQIKVILFEDLLQNTSQILNEILEFLGVESQEFPQLPHTNQGWAPAFPKLNQWLIAKNPLISLFQLRQPKGTQITRLPPRLRQFIMKQIGKKPISSLTAADRATAYPLFQADIQALEALLCRDLSLWKPSHTPASSA